MGFPKESVAAANANVQQPAWKKRVSAISTSDYGKVGIQLGKTKVFLRHKAFEVLERIRSTEQNKAATKLNALFRRYMARVAYIPYRDAFRQELRERRKMFEHANAHKESKEEEWDDGNATFRSRGHVSLDGQTISSVGTASPIFSFNYNYQSESLVDKWFESQIRDAIRNPVPRHQWGKAAPSDEQNFKWVISEEGLWVKNYSSFNAKASPSD
jgi:myosin heavy subunit